MSVGVQGKSFRLGLRDLLSLEGALAFFFFAGTFKVEGTEGVTISLSDPTVISWLLVTILAAVRLAQSGLQLRVYEAKYLLAHIFAVSLIIVSSAFTSGGSEEKALLYVIFNFYAVVVGVLLVNNRERAWRFAKACLIVAFIAIIISIVDFSSNRTSSPELLGADGYQWISRAAFMSATIAAGMFVYDSRLGWRIFYLTVVIFGVYTLFLSGGRQGVLALGIGLSAIALGAARGRVRGRILVGALVLSMVAGGAWYLIASDIVPIWSLPRGVQRIWLTLTGGYENNRMPLYLEGLRIWTENPVAGVGWGRFVDESTLIYYKHPHNVFIEVLAETGLIGAAVFSVIIGLPLVRAIVSLLSRPDPELAIVFATTVGLLGAIQTSGDIVSNRLFFFFLIMLLHLSAQPRVIRPPLPSGRVTLRSRA